MFGSVLSLVNHKPQLPGERPDDFVARVILAVDRLDAAAWATLPAKVQTWLNAAIRKVESGSFKGLADEA